MARRHILIIIGLLTFAIGIAVAVAQGDPKSLRDEALQNMTDYDNKADAAYLFARDQSCVYIGRLIPSCFASGKNCDALQEAEAEHENFFKEDPELCRKAAEEVIHSEASTSSSSAALAPVAPDKDYHFFDDTEGVM